jgi:hypothetical protein
VQILVQRLEDVVLVPIQVVANRGGRKVCYVNTPRGPEEREVQTGAFNDTFTEITEGLEPGEEVLMNPPTFTEGVTDTTEADQQRFGGRKAMEPGNAGDQAQGQTKATKGRGETTLPEQRPKPGGAQFEIPDDQIDGIMAGIKQLDPAKAKELEALRKSNPDEFKTKLQEYLRSKMKEMGRGRQGDARGGRSGPPEQGDAGRSRPQPR